MTGTKLKASLLTDFCSEDRVIWESKQRAKQRHIVSDGSLYYTISEQDGTAMVIGRWWDSPTRINVPEQIQVENKTFTVTAIADGAFDTKRDQHVFTALRSITLPQSITRIGENAFRGNQFSLENIQIPEECEVADSAFNL